MAAEVSSMPYNRDAEMALLGCLIIDNAILTELVGGLDEEDFYIESHKYIIRAIRQVFGGSQPVDLVTLSDELDGEGNLDKAGGIAYLTELAGLPQTGYQQYLEELWQELPIINTVGYVDSQGNWVHTSQEELLSPAAQTALDGYKRVLYNNIFDKGRRPADFFTLATP